jgi:hypothetical protein
MKKLHNRIAVIAYQIFGNLVRKGHALHMRNQINQELKKAGCDPLDPVTESLVEDIRNKNWNILDTVVD